MVALLMAMTVMAIMMTVAMPTWKQLAQREKETELVFRGEQYARAITLFQAKAGPGTLPPSVDLLVDQRFLRKKYKDPITNDDFVPLLQAAPTAPGQAPGAPQSGTGRQGAPVQQPQQQQPAGGTAQRGTVGAQPGSTPGAPVGGGIMGFTSKSKEQSIRLYKGRSHYNEWQFTPVARVATPGTSGAPGQPGPPGGNRGNRGTNPPNPFNNPNTPNPTAPNPLNPVGGRTGR